MKWTDKQGKVWNIWDMETEHIKKSVKKLQLKIVEYRNILIEFNEELEERENGKAVGIAPKYASSVIHVCGNCGKLDATYADGHDCGEHEATVMNREATEYNN